MRLGFVFLSCFAVVAQEPADLAQQLGQVKRIYVDKLTGGEAADQIRDMLMASLQGAKLWVITENQDKADAFLRGAADDLIFSETRESRDSIDARGSVSTRDGAYSSSNRVGNRQDRSASFGVGQSEGSRATERKHEATAAMRLVNKEGDLIWSTTKESNGAKFKGSAADVADKVVKQLVLDFEAARKPSPAAQK